VTQRYLAATDLHPEVRAILQEFFGLLHALYWSHWTAHWQAHGNPFYGDHLLFERLYKGVTEEIDTLAEKMVARFGASAVDAVDHFPITQAWVDRWKGQENPYKRALLAESDFQEAVRKVYDSIKEVGAMSLGLDDFLMASANDHETHMYLLQQRLRSEDVLKTASAGMDRLDGGGVADMSAEAHFFDKPRARETREFAQSKAVTNVPDVAEGAIKAEELADSPRTVRKQVRETPLDVTEIVAETPGSDEFSTLSRYVVETEQTDEPGVPQGHHEVDKHPNISRVASRWLAR
jgi:DNA-binding ferritin-like protein